MRRCRWLHIWSRWVSEIFEAPYGDLVVLELKLRYCLVCRITDEREEVLSCVSS